MGTKREKPLSAQTEKVAREKWISSAASGYAISQGYSNETAIAFARFCQGYAPEVQGFGNLFDYYVDTLTP